MELFLTQLIGIPLVKRLLTLVGAVGSTLAFFLVLPLIQAISAPPHADLMLQTMDTVELPPPPPPPEAEPEPETEEEPPPPELSEAAQPLDLSQLELVLNPSFGSGLAGGTDFAMKLNTTMAAGDDVEALFSMADLDQKPRVIYQPGPVVTAQLRKKAPATVYVLFVVDPKGRVTKPIVQKSTDRAFERAALNAVKQWRFEPGKRKGEPVNFRMRVPITFPKQ